MKRIQAVQLDPLLQQGLAPGYLLAGQDPLLLDESRQALIQYAGQQQFDEVLQRAVDNAADWDDLYQRCHSRGLFYQKSVLLLTLPDTLNQSLQKKLSALIGLLHADILLVLQFSRFNLQTEKQGWFSALEQYSANRSVLVNCQTPTPEQLPQWIQQRAKALQLTLDSEALQLLAYSYESNLLALKQLLNLLKLVYPEGKINYLKAKACVEQSSVFTPYQWLDAMLEGKTKRAVRILYSLKNEDVQPLILLRSAQKELNTILQLAGAERVVNTAAPLPLHNLRQHFDRLRVWQNRRPFFTKAMQRMRYADLFRLLQKLAQIERQLKRDFDADVWPMFEDFTLLFSHHAISSDRIGKSENG
ncbi:DNA polymerase III subunit delta [Chelonobacter oris]|uniref:DNA polymerase III subunit delta n=1 Tax=Chelonobacter oris TaxID=505317 RepID=UPI000A02EE32|nr:DNA polymerase III subunit delta [Chelonobacter oris]